MPRVAWWSVAVLSLLALGGVAMAVGHRSPEPASTFTEAGMAHGTRSAAETTATARGTSTRRTCIVRPAACGYPSAAGTGVPAGTVLQRSGSITVTTPGAVVARRDVRGTIVVAADGVTIVDTLVTTADPNGSAVYVKPNVRGTVIRDSTLRGSDDGPGAVEYGILNAGWLPNATTRAVGVKMYRCTECYAGPGTLRDSYVHVNAVVPGAHYEPVYYGGGAGPLTVDHNTLLNPRPQTAIVFGGTDFGPQQHLTITDNLMAGGGWMVYGGGDHPETRDVVVSGNRFSRRYFPRGGSFGVSAHMRWPRTQWSGNVWDGTLRRVGG